MQDLRPITIGLVVIMALFWAFSAIKKRTMFNRLQTLLSQQKYDEFYGVLDSKLCGLLFPEYNRTYLRLNAYLMQGREEEAEVIFNDLLTRRLPKRQRIDLVIKAFSFFVERKNKKRSRELLNEIESWEDESAAKLKRECRRSYDILILKRSSYIEEMKRELEAAKGMQRTQLIYYLALQYENKGDKKTSDRYLALMAEELGEIMGGATSKDSASSSDDTSASTERVSEDIASEAVENAGENEGAARTENQGSADAVDADADDADANSDSQDQDAAGTEGNAL